MWLERNSRRWRWLVGSVLVALIVWRLGSTGFARRQFTKPRAAAADFGQWTFIGPTHLYPTGDTSAYSGRVTSIAVDPADPNHWLVGAAMGGVWDTRDAGATWQPRTDSQPSLAIGAIAFSPGSPSVVYAGTGEACFSRWCYAGAGMLRSNDSGVTWSVVNTATFARGSVRTIVVDPTDANVLVAGTARGYSGRDLVPVTSPPGFGVQRSTNGGQTWTRTLIGQISALVRHPDNFSLQFAAVGDPSGTPATSSAGDFQSGTMPNGVYRTTDGGEHWTPVPGPWTSPDAATFAAGAIMLAVAPARPDVMYASVQSAGGSTRPLLGLFRTNNAWAATPEWTRIPIDAVQTGSVVGFCDQCAYANVISVDPADADTLFAGGLNMWRCRSCATAPSWTQFIRLPGDSVHSDHHALTWVGNRLIDGNDGGVYSSIDRGASWRSHNTNLPLVQFYGGAVHPTRADLVLGNTQDNLLVRWTGVGSGDRMFSSLSVAEGQVFISASRPDTDWAITHTYAAVARTTNGGGSFQQVQAGIDNPAPFVNVAFMPTLRKCPGNDDVVFVGANRLWRTNNFFSAPAPSWSVNAPDIDVAGCPAPGRPQAACAVIHSLAFAGSDTSCSAYAYGTGGGFMRITANGGASWSDFDPSDGVPGRAITGIAFAVGDRNVAYVTVSGIDEATPGKPGHVFKSTNALAASPTWTNVSPPTNVPFNTIAIDPSSSNTLYAGADNGVWASNDGGATWAYMGPESGLPNVAVFDLQIQASTGKLFAFTFGRGAYRLTK